MQSIHLSQIQIIRAHPSEEEAELDTGRTGQRFLISPRASHSKALETTALFVLLDMITCRTRRVYRVYRWPYYNHLTAGMFGRLLLPKGQ